MKKKLLFSLLSFYFILNYGQNKNIGINTTDPKTTLHINANSTGTVAEGLIIPRLTGDQIKNMPVTTTENGMMIFATSGAASPSGTAININSEGFYFWNSVNNVWEKLNANPANTAWALSGNTATATSFLGTTNNIDLQFKRNNTLVGKLSNSNISFGLYALNPATTGSYNNALGYYSLGQNTTGTYNNALGMYSLRVNTTGAGNNAIGYYSLGSNSTGNYNSAYGYQSLQYTTGSNNIGIGYNSAVPTTSGSNQLSIGNSIYGLNINDGNASNDLIGIGTTAPQNTLHVNGTNPLRLQGLQTGAATDNVLTVDTNGVVRSQTTASFLNNNWSLDGNTATATSFLGTTHNFDLQFKRNNTLIGKLSTNNVSFGSRALNSATTGIYNNALGGSALYYNTSGGYNNALGVYSLYSNTTGTGNNGTGHQSLYNNSTGNYNSAYGYSALSDTTGSNNIGIGNVAQVPTASGSNQMSIGNSIYGLNINDGNASNDLIGIGVSAPTEALDVNGNARIRSVYTNNGAATDRVVVADTNGNIKTIDRSMINNIYTADGTITGNRIVTLNGGNIRFAKTGTAITGSLMEVDGKIKTTAVNLNSDARLKEKVANINQETSFLNNLRPVSYYWNAKGKEKGGDNSLQYGFIAQEVEKIAPNLVNTDADGYKSVNYIQVIPVLVKSLQDHALELQKEKEKNNQQEQRIKALEEKINAILKK